MEFLAQSIEGGAISEWVTSTVWLWPLMEIIHFIGLSLLLGALIVIDLRLAGFFRQISLAATHKLLPFVFLGFGLNLVTGVLFFIGDPMRYSANIGFKIKMILVIIAGLNSVWYYRKISPLLHTWGPNADTSTLAKTIALISLGCWTGVLLLGRLIPYVGTG